LVSEPVEAEKWKKRVQSPPSSPSYGLVSFKELPEYMKDNEFILNYYRANWPLKEALFSIFRWHNETLNVWTHLLGFVLFLGLTMANLIEVPQVSDLIAFLTSSFPISGDSNVSQDPFLVRNNDESRRLKASNGFGTRRFAGNAVAVLRILSRLHVLPPIK
ncbi:hypothetical protein Godav_001780, partial [Gossypium davidsonii]|nr:hypothetical protein [Gossypium davidsonii]